MEITKFKVGEKVYIKPNLNLLKNKTHFGIVTEVGESSYTVNPLALPKYNIGFYPSELKKVK